MSNSPIDTLRRTGDRTATDDEFRRDVALQVYLPLGLGVLAIGLAVGTALLTGGAGGLAGRGLADVSIIVLLLPVMLLGLMALIGFAALAVAIGRLIGWLPPRSRRLQRLTARIARRTEAVADRTVQVVVVPKALASVARSLSGSLRFKRGGGGDG